MMSRRRREGPIDTTVLFATSTDVNIRVRCPTSECLEASLSGFPARLLGQAQKPPERSPILSPAINPARQANETRHPRSAVLHKPVTALAPKVFFLKRRSLKKTFVFDYADTFMYVREDSTWPGLLPGISVSPSLKKHLNLATSMASHLLSVSCTRCLF